jgi:hypothetical protein
MSDNIIPLRPRDEVPRLIRSFRSEPPEHAFIASAPMRIDGTVVLSRFLRGLRSAGLTFQHDERTGEFVVMPRPEGQS